ncbi:hypothetical protein QN277_013043 [Acacia crassicarpa]|nr:hypothetical protein QN277_013043 [Acacia crassicarpa]
MSPAIIMLVDDDVERCHEETPEAQYQTGVKLLCENGLHRLPKKYIWPPSERPTRTDTQDPNVAGKQNLQLPVIDLADLLGPKRSQVLHSLADACQQYGFFQLVNHGIAEDVIRKMREVSERFFDLAYEERAKYMINDLRAPVRYGTSFSQTIDTVFCWRDFLKLQCHPLPDFLPSWPSSPVDLREVASTYAQETKYLFLTLMEAILESLGIVEARQEETKRKEILKDFEDGSQIMVANYYPPCPEPDLTLGMPPHSDYGFLTLLLQDDVVGLQIHHQQRWLAVDPMPNAIVVNIGDHLEIYTNGRYKSVLHRVLVNSVKSRISVASLHSLPFNYMVRPSPKVIDEKNPKRYRDTDFGSFLDYISTKEPKRKDFLESRKLTN